MTDQKKLGRVSENSALSPTQQKLYDALVDGQAHPIKELAALIDEQCSDDNLRMHMSNLRTRIRQQGGATIICEAGCYRKVAYTA